MEKSTFVFCDVCEIDIEKPENTKDLMAMLPTKKNKQTYCT